MIGIEKLGHDLAHDQMLGSIFAALPPPGDDQDAGLAVAQV